MKTASLLLTITLPALLMMTGCQTSSSSSNTSPPLAGTEWILSELNGAPVLPSEGLTTPTLTLNEADRKVTGSSGLNRYGGPFELNGSSLTFGLFIGTRRAGPPQAMAVEDSFLAAMRKVKEWTIAGNQLALTGEGVTLMRFTTKME